MTSSRTNLSDRSRRELLEDRIIHPLDQEPLDPGNWFDHGGGERVYERIIGASFETAPSDPRVILDADGLRFIDDTGVVLVDLDTETGSATFKGDITSGSTITGATIRTSDSDPMVIMDSGGLRLVNSLGTTVVNLDTATGAGSFEGTIIATAGEIRGNLDLGGSLSTGTVGARLVLSDAGLELYNASNVVTVDLDAATGDATFKGTIIATDGEISGGLTLSGALEVLDGVDVAMKLSTDGLDMFVEDGTESSYDVIGWWRRGAGDTLPFAALVGADFTTGGFGQWLNLVARNMSAHALTSLNLSVNDALDNPLSSIKIAIGAIEGRVGAGNLSFEVDETGMGADQTSLSIAMFDGVTIHRLRRVEVGAVDSAGAGFRTLRVAN